MRRAPLNFRWEAALMSCGLLRPQLCLLAGLCDGLQHGVLRYVANDDHLLAGKVNVHLLYACQRAQGGEELALKESRTPRLPLYDLSGAQTVVP